MVHSSYQPKFYLIFPQVSFQHFNHSYFVAQDFAEPFFFTKHLSLTAFDLYDSHLDDSGLEHIF